VALFQKVHGKMVMLQRLDAQLGGLLEQRRKVTQEIQQLQSNINDEIDRQLKAADELPARILAEIADTSRNGSFSSSRMSELDRTETAVSTTESDRE
jgi:hypothetical protein